MLEIHPLTDEAQLCGYIEKNGLPEDAVVLRAYENGDVTGNISLTLETKPDETGAMKAFLLINTLEYPDDFTGELLLRAAASFAFNRMIPGLRAGAEMKAEFFDRVGFKTEGNFLTIATQNVVHLCK